MGLCIFLSECSIAREALLGFQPTPAILSPPSASTESCLCLAKRVSLAQRKPKTGSAQYPRLSLSGRDKAGRSTELCRPRSKDLPGVEACSPTRSSSITPDEEARERMLLCT